MGKRAVLIFPETQKEKDKEATKNTNELRNENHDLQPKKKPKLQCVPGAIGALIDQAEVVGLQLAVNQQDELEFRRDGRGSIPLTRWGKKAWTTEIKKHINGDLLQELHEAVKPA